MISAIVLQLSGWKMWDAEEPYKTILFPAGKLVVCYNFAPLLQRPPPNAGFTSE